jgi:hypothetical protein
MQSSKKRLIDDRWDADKANPEMGGLERSLLECNCFAEDFFFE